MSLPRVVYWNNIPAPYMVERFNAAARRGNLDFEAWFNARHWPGRSWAVDESTWEFPFRYLPSVAVDGRRLSIPTPLLRREPPDLLVSLYGEPSFLLGWAIARRRGVRTAFWCEVTFDRWVPRRPWKEQVKRSIFRRVDATLLAGEQGRAYAMRYGVSPERALLLPHVIDVAHFVKGREEVMRSREQTRAKVGLRGVTFIYVGRMWWGKGLDHLLDAYSILQRRTEGEVSLLLVGDGPEEAHLRERTQAEGLRNVAFAGFVQKPDLPRHYTMADIFVFPTLGDPYGLVVDEAMACSLPVISTSAAGEIGDRVEDGINGYVVPPENSAALLDRMELLARDPGLRARMGEASARKIAGHTPERWAEGFEGAVEAILARPRVGKGSEHVQYVACDRWPRARMGTASTRKTAGPILEPWAEESEDVMHAMHPGSDPK
jgi:glycosyltransferase involved in cell wall biosynthesis